MSDDSVRSALRSTAALVVIEAPGGCGKTHQGSEFTRDVAALVKPGRLLILTHTHAACSVFDGKTKGIGGHVEIRTIDSLISQIASAYHLGLGLPPDAAVWARQNGKEGYGQLAVRVAALLKRYPSIAGALASRYPLIVCDEHQDCTGEQHAVVMAIHQAGAQLRIFADPMQKIFKDTSFTGGCLPLDWEELKRQADSFEELDVPHRWSDGDPELGKWILRARTALKNGNTIDLTSGVPAAVKIIRADSAAYGYGDYRLASADRRPIDAFVNSSASLMVLAHHSITVAALRPFFNRRILLWEGHTRKGLEALVELLGTPQTAESLAKGIIKFMAEVGTGFSASAFGNDLEKEAREGCTARRRGKPAKVQSLAQLLVDQPDFRGVSKVLARLAALRENDDDFKIIHIDYEKEFWEAVRLGEYATVEEGLSHIAHKRTYSRPSPPPKSLSTVHKAKGLECEDVLLVACDATQFPDTPLGRCLLYVALSRAKKNLMIVIPRSNPSPLFNV